MATAYRYVCVGVGVRVCACMCIYDDRLIQLVDTEGSEGTPSPDGLPRAAPGTKFCKDNEDPATV